MLCAVQIQSREHLLDYAGHTTHIQQQRELDRTKSEPRSTVKGLDRQAEIKYLSEVGKLQYNSSQYYCCC